MHYWFHQMLDRKSLDDVPPLLFDNPARQNSVACFGRSYSMLCLTIQIMKNRFKMLAWSKDVDCKHFVFLTYRTERTYKNENQFDQLTKMTRDNLIQLSRLRTCMAHNYIILSQSVLSMRFSTWAFTRVTKGKLCEFYGQISVWTKNN